MAPLCSDRRRCRQQLLWQGVVVGRGDLAHRQCGIFLGGGSVAGTPSGFGDALCQRRAKIQGLTAQIGKVVDRVLRKHGTRS